LISNASCAAYVEVYHGRLVCFDAEQAHSKARAAAETAAIAAASVVPSDGGAAAEGGAAVSAAARAAREIGVFGGAGGGEGGVAIPCGGGGGNSGGNSGGNKNGGGGGGGGGGGNSTQRMGVVDFGVVGVPGTRFRRMAVLNPNPVPITLQSVLSSVHAVRVTKVGRLYKLNPVAP
jgi:hypothetical protein